MIPRIPPPAPGATSQRRAHALALLVGACTMLAAQLGSAGELKDPRRWLDRMVEAARTLTYDGIFVYRSGNMVESMRILHRFDGGGERERLVSLDGVAREVIRDNEQVTCILPDSEDVVIGKRRLRGVNAGPLFSGSGIPGQYEVSFAGKDRVAGRGAARLQVNPYDDRRYGYRLWLDLQTGLLLRSALLGPEGDVLEEIAYTSLTVPAQIPDELLRPSLSGPGVTSYQVSAQESAPRPSADSGWRVASLPRGFELREHVVGSIPHSDVPIEHMVFSDGLASLSVFIERLANRAEALEGPSRMGAVSAFGRMVGEHQVTVVGEVPMQTVEDVGLGVTRR